MSVLRQDIISALAIQLGKIKVADGYHTDCGLNVFLWKSAAVEKTDLPCIILQDEKNDFLIEGVHVVANAFTQWLSVSLVIVLSQGGTTDTMMRQAFADVYRAIGTDDTYGGIALQTRLISDEIQIQQEARTIAAGVVKIEIMWRTGKYKETWP
jgi:hypothetical protein